MQIYVGRDGDQRGPYSLEEIQQYLAQGELQLTDPVWHEGLDNWVWIPLGEVPGVVVIQSETPSGSQREGFQSQRRKDQHLQRPRRNIFPVVCMVIGLGSLVAALFVFQQGHPEPEKANEGPSASDDSKVEKSKTSSPVCNRVGPGASLRGANLRGCDLNGKNLQGTNFSDANLMGANLSGTLLSATNFEGADMMGVNLRGLLVPIEKQGHPALMHPADLPLYAVRTLRTVGGVGHPVDRFAKRDVDQRFIVAVTLDLFREKFNFEPPSDFSGANLHGVNLSRRFLVSPNFSNAELMKARVINAELPGANMFNANLKAANLSGSNLAGGNLTGADLTGAALVGAALVGVRLNRAKLSKANLQRAYMVGADLTGANVQSADFRLSEGLNLEGTIGTPAFMPDDPLDE